MDNTAHFDETNEDKCTCPSSEEHTCPYDEEMSNDNEDLNVCACCAYCTLQCAYSI